MGPTEVDGLLFGGAAEQPVDEAGGVTVAAADAVDAARTALSTPAKR